MGIAVNRENEDFASNRVLGGEKPGPKLFAETAFALESAPGPKDVARRVVKEGKWEGKYGVCA